MIEFEKDIPIPPAQAANMADNDLYTALADMPVDASFAVGLTEDLIVDESPFSRVKCDSFRETMSRYGKRHGHRYTTRILRENGRKVLRIWRVS